MYDELYLVNTLVRSNGRILRLNWSLNIMD